MISFSFEWIIDIIVKVEVKGKKRQQQWKNDAMQYEFNTANDGKGKKTATKQMTKKITDDDHDLVFTK